MKRAYAINELLKGIRPSLRIRQFTITVFILLVGSSTYGQRMHTFVNTKGQKSTHVECNSTFTINQGSDANGCYYDISVSPVWGPTTTDANGNCNVVTLPHGLCVQVSGATIVSAGSYSSWFSGATIHTGSAYVYGIKEPLLSATCSSPCPCSSALNALPENVAQSLRIYVTPASTCGTVVVLVTILSGGAWDPPGSTPPSWGPPPASVVGWSYPNSPWYNYWKCGALDTFTCPQNSFVINDSSTVCSGTFKTYTLTAVPPAQLPSDPASVKWYKIVPCPSAPPTTNPPAAPWVLAQDGGFTYNTNEVTQCEYLEALVTTGCYTVHSQIRKVNVCSGAPTGSITAIPFTGYPALLGPTHRACRQWKGSLFANINAATCGNVTYQWYYKGVPVPYENAANFPSWGTSSDPALTLNEPTARCDTGYDYKVVVKNLCDSTTFDYAINIDKKPWGGKVTAQTPNFWDVGTGTVDSPILCNGMGTRLIDSITCGRVARWEQRVSSSNCPFYFYGPFGPVPVNSATNLYWTNDLTLPTEYRAIVENQSCNTPSTVGYSDPILVAVKPVLAVTVTPLSGTICNNSMVMLTSATNYNAACGYGGVTYQWYKDAEKIPGATNANFSAPSCGIYFVKAYDVACGDSATSKLVTICQPTLIVDAPCCICHDGKAILNAEVKWCTKTCSSTSCTIKWRKQLPNGNWEPTAHSNPYQITQPGIYKVEAQCGGCILKPQIVTIKPCCQ